MGYNLADRFGQRRCADFLDCNEGECCVKGRSVIGKRNVLDEVLDAASEVINQPLTEIMEMINMI